MGLFSCLFFYTILSDILVSITNHFAKGDVDFGRRSFFGVLGLTALTGLVGAIQAIRGPKTYNVEVPIKNLPNGFDGYKILQISDLHVGPTIGKTYTEKVRNISNKLEPDMVALTGDLYDGFVGHIQNDLKPISEIQSKDGTFFVTGNHEYYWNYPDWEKTFQSWGFQILENSHKVITRDGSTLTLVGLPDVQAESTLGLKPNIIKALENSPKESTRILLAHRPDLYQLAKDYGFSLQLSGHTHGGQYIPWKFLVALVWKYYIGLNNHNGTWVYVSRGTGYWGPPIRFAVPSEITLITLRRASSSK